MAIRVVTDASVLSEARAIVSGATNRVWIASAWVRGDALRALLGDIAVRIDGGLDVRLVYRVKEAQEVSRRQKNLVLSRNPDVADPITSAATKVAPIMVSTMELVFQAPLLLFDLPQSPPGAFTLTFFIFGTDG